MGRYRLILWSIRRIPGVQAFVFEPQLDTRFDVLGREFFEEAVAFLAIHDLLCKMIFFIVRKHEKIHEKFGFLAKKTNFMALNLGHSLDYSIRHWWHLPRPSLRRPA
jgi:hypothetical protein